MDFEEILNKAQSALKLIGEGRKVLTSIQEQIADGKVILKTNEQQQLNALLADEQVETEAAYQDLKAAIAESRE